ncbi:hypothetical protein [Bradyrhizobium sp. 930_D9_N1_4]|uniref:hypothetical protein n=1 Tax=Bradyrhizobium sp. 930_D9_N1_4 TaxID=3240374 RepID=UPI003F88AAB0
MADLEVANGIVVRSPDDVDIRVVQDGPARRGVRRGIASQITGADQRKGAGGI